MNAVQSIVVVIMGATDFDVRCLSQRLYVHMGQNAGDNSSSTFFSITFESDVQSIHFLVYLRCRRK